MKKRKKEMKTPAALLNHLLRIMEKLRSPGGCPWDRRQTHRSLRPYLLEEAHETLEAIDRRDPVALQEELGDLLLQIVFHAQIASERGRFAFSDIVQSLNEKLIRRHPHVFSGERGRREAVLRLRWEETKQREKPERVFFADGLPKALPALLRAERFFEKASHPFPEVLSKLSGEVHRAFKKWIKSLKGRSLRRRQKYFGEFLLAACAVSRMHRLQAENCLQEAVRRLEQELRKKEKKHASHRQRRR